MSQATTMAHSRSAAESPVKIPPNEPDPGYTSTAVLTGSYTGSSEPWAASATTTKASSETCESRPMTLWSRGSPPIGSIALLRPSRRLMPPARTIPETCISAPIASLAEKRNIFQLRELYRIAIDRGRCVFDVSLCWPVVRGNGRDSHD